MVDLRPTRNGSLIVLLHPHSNTGEQSSAYAIQLCLGPLNKVGMLLYSVTEMVSAKELVGTSGGGGGLGAASSRPS